MGNYQDQPKLGKSWSVELYKNGAVRLYTQNSFFDVFEFDIRTVTTGGSCVQSWFDTVDTLCVGGDRRTGGGYNTQYFKGDKGNTGATGATGATGENGQDGTNGTNGKDGRDTVSTPLIITSVVAVIAVVGNIAMVVLCITMSKKKIG